MSIGDVVALLFKSTPLPIPPNALTTSDDKYRQNVISAMTLYPKLVSETNQILEKEG